MAIAAVGIHDFQFDRMIRVVTVLEIRRWDCQCSIMDEQNLLAVSGPGSIMTISRVRAFLPDPPRGSSRCRSPASADRPQVYAWTR